MNTLQSICVTVQVPTFNQENFLGKTIASVLEQDYPNLELVIADDCSPDNTSTLVQSFPDKRVRYFRNEKNLGRIGNYRKSLYEYVSGDWVVNLDGDDFFCDFSWIAHAAKTIGGQGPSDIVFFQGNHKKEKLKQIFPDGTWINDTDILVEGCKYFIRYPRLASFNHAATLYKRNIALNVGFYSFDCLYTDFNSMAKLSLEGSVILSCRNVSVWRLHDFNISRRLKDKYFNSELASLQDISTYSQKFIDYEQANIWTRQTWNLILSRFIDLSLETETGWQTMKLVLRHWQFNMPCFKGLVKSILRITGIR